jgi:hypothetical protein
MLKVLLKTQNKNTMLKRITTTLAISLLCLTVFSQKKDSVATDHTPLFSIRDISVIDSTLKKKVNLFGVDDYNQLLSYLQQLVNQRIREYNVANKPSPAKK